MKLREAAQQALEALEVWRDSLTNPSAIPVWRFSVLGEKAITDLRDALYEDAMQRFTDVQQQIERHADTGKTSDHIAAADKMVATIRPDVTVEPVAWSYTDARGRTVVVSANTAPYEDAKPLYSAPPKRKPLTEEELSDVVSNETRGHLDRDTYTYALVCMIARAMERAHGIGGEE